MPKLSIQSKESGKNNQKQQTTPEPVIYSQIFHFDQYFSEHTIDVTFEPYLPLLRKRETFSQFHISVFKFGFFELHREKEK